jgi:hypothetical protein
MDLNAMQETIEKTDSAQRSDKLTVEQLCDEIATRRRTKYASRTKPYPRNNPIASDISDCVRETVLGITNWKDRPEFPVEVIERMERGNQVEDWIFRELMDLGYSVRVDRQSWELRDKKGRIIARGRIDGFLSIGRETYPFECKSMHPNMYGRINSIEDFDRYQFFRKYPRQLQSYLFANNLDQGFWILDDLLGHWKLIPCRLDYDRAEKILRHLESAVEHLANKTLPPFHSDPTVCLKCWAYTRVCTPPFASGEGMQVIDDPEFSEKLKRRAKLDNAASEFDRLDREIKGFLKQTMKPEQIFIIGDYLVSAEEKIRNMNPQPAKEASQQKYLAFNIESMKAATEGESPA